MSAVVNIYDNGPISPVARINENLSIWTAGKWEHNRIIYMEPMPRSSPMVVEMVSASGAVTIAANGTIAKRLVAILRMGDTELMHLRWEPIDDMEGVLWEQSSVGRFVARNVHARVDRLTHIRDPYLATTTFFIVGKERDMNLEVRNPNGIALPLARFVFFGYRYLLEPLRVEPQNTTYLPAEGRGG